MWFRRDLRLDDNPALLAALRRYECLLPLYIHAPQEEAPWAPGAASNWWLHHSLTALDHSLRARGSRLLIMQGGSLDCLHRLMAAHGHIDAVLWNRCYEPAAIARDSHVKQQLRAAGMRCASHNSSLLFEPWEVKTSAEQPFKVFTAYWRRCQARLADIPPPQLAPEQLPPVALPTPALSSLAEQPLDALGLLPRIGWDVAFATHWQPGAAGAQQQLHRFLDQAVADYPEARDHPGSVGTSRLSPHLHFGDIGPRQILAAIRALDHDSQATDAFVRQLGWREFSVQLLYHFPQTDLAPLNPLFAEFPWRDPAPSDLLQAWQQGHTGIPLVDAGMRELWHSGWMHNRVRMVVASFLTKNLRLPWQSGARWFWDTLLDANLANNTQGWQWTAGCGADAAPYFRIFNPARQGERFDPAGDYVRHWCPELARLPQRYLHQPWTAPVAALQQFGVRLGGNYPQPIIDLAASRREALAFWQQLRHSDRGEHLA
nr:deoxyribodipyrimidine photo-lyase [Rhabdochromatium marinum]